MKKTIYISGSISDNRTGLPRKGWQKEFRAAEQLLGKMGYGTVSPIDIARQTEREWRDMWASQSWNSESAMRMPELPTRATYVMACLEAMNTEALAGRLHGVWLLGGVRDDYAKSRLYHSHGVQMELHMAVMLNLPVFAEFYGGCEVDLHLLPVRDGLKLCPGGEFGTEDWSEKL